MWTLRTIGYPYYATHSWDNSETIFMSALTELTIRKLPNPASGSTKHLDPSLPGFGVRCTSRSKAFFVMFGEERRMKTLGKWPELSLKDARQAARSVLVCPPPIVHGNRSFMKPVIASLLNVGSDFAQPLSIATTTHSKICPTPNSKTSALTSMNRTSWKRSRCSSTGALITASLIAILFSAGKSASECVTGCSLTKRLQRSGRSTISHILTSSSCSFWPVSVVTRFGNLNRVGLMGKS